MPITAPSLQSDHPTFQRKGADLVIKKEITLLEALTGTSICAQLLITNLMLTRCTGVKMWITHLDGHKVYVESKPGEVIGHEATKQVRLKRGPFVCGLTSCANVGAGQR
jgi:DnaJ-class molecular chaperone